MSSRSASRLDSGLIARKGEATPAITPVLGENGVTTRGATTQASQPPERETAEAGGARSVARGLHGTIAVTVRLDPVRYERLKVHGARRRRTNQEILVEALDAYLHANAE